MKYWEVPSSWPRAVRLFWQNAFSQVAKTCSLSGSPLHVITHIYIYAVLALVFVVCHNVGQTA